VYGNCNRLLRREKRAGANRSSCNTQPVAQSTSDGESSAHTAADESITNAANGESLTTANRKSHLRASNREPATYPTSFGAAP